MTRLLLAAGLVAGMAASAAVAQTGQFKARLDRLVTPGEVASADRMVVCDYDASGNSYSKEHRRTTEAMKQMVAHLYGIPWWKHNQYEFDHLVPLALGGADTIKNIWPQPWAEARRKDDLERAKWEGVCLRDDSLAAAQRYFLSGEWEGK